MTAEGGVFELTASVNGEVSFEKSGELLAALRIRKDRVSHVEAEKGRIGAFNALHQRLDLGLPKVSPGTPIGVIIQHNATEIV
ncbi:hypothetical protein NPIL_485481 [Nephila pilipes]|uniref:Uncharacterized protein n=1 Tax=Nephila pilipes TaxID=299642 RepID=A0A8X6NUN0_NEPPI|nr:hypothetical protein NPIL_485481 [Nephila pilipes]